MTWEQFDYACQEIAKQVPKTITDVYGIPRGGLIVAIRLSYLLNKPLILNVNEISQYTLAIDDISDTGKTLQQLREVCARADLENTGTSHFTIATLVYHKQSKVIPDIWVYEKGDKYVNFPWEKRLEK